MIDKAFSANNINSTSTSNSNPLVFFQSKNVSKNANKKLNQNGLNKKEQILQFNEETINIMSILLMELTNIKNALINSSADIERVFKLPLSHLKINVSFIKSLYYKPFVKFKYNM